MLLRLRRLLHPRAMLFSPLLASCAVQAQRPQNPSPSAPSAVEASTATMVVWPEIRRAGPGADTVAMPDARTLPWHEALARTEFVSGEPFVNGVSASDVRQGGVNDCWLNATLASVAAKQPKLLERLVVPAPNRPGVYRVTLHERQGRALVPVTHSVTSRFPHAGVGRLAYSHSPDARELWVSLVQKRAVYTFERMENGGQGYGALEHNDPRLALEMVLGRKAFILRSSSVDEIERRAGEGVPLVVTTHADRALYQGTGVQSAHAYSLQRVYRTSEGARRFVLYNASLQEMGQDGSRDGFFELSEAQFLRYARYVYGA